MGYLARNYVTGSDGSLSGAVNVGSGSGRAVVVTVLSGSGGGITLTGLTIDGASVTPLDNGNNGLGAIFYCAARVVDGTGSINVTATFSASGSTKRLHLMAFDGIDSVRGGHVNWANGNAAPGATVATAAGDVVTLQGNDAAFGRTFSASAPAVLTSATGSNFDAYEVAAGASTTIDGTLSGNANWYVGAVALVPAAAGDPPQGAVTIGTITPGTTTALVAYTYDDSDADSYEYRLDGGTPAAIGASPATITGLTAETEYDIEIRAINANGAGAWSTVASFETGAEPPPVLWGFDLDDPALDLRVGNVSGTLIGLALAASTNWTVRVRNPNSGAEVLSDVVSTDADGYLPRIEDAALASGWYEITGQSTETGVGDRRIWSVLMQTTETP